jgi:hypothetical protein
LTYFRWCDEFHRVSSHPPFSVVYIRLSGLALYLGPKSHTIVIPGIMSTDAWSPCSTVFRIAETAFRLSVYPKESVKFVHLTVSPWYWWTFLTPFTINPPKLVFSDDKLSVIWARTKTYASGPHREYLHRVQTIASVMILRYISHHRGPLAATANHLWCNTAENRHLTDITCDTSYNITCDAVLGSLPR